jgi:hypothetical protein
LPEVKRVVGDETRGSSQRQHLLQLSAALAPSGGGDAVEAGRIEGVLGDGA